MTTQILFIVNDAPYGNERAYNALRLAGSLLAKEDVLVRVFLMADAVGCAKDHQKVPEGYYNIELMISQLIRKGEVVGAVGRPDLAGREEEMAATLWESLQHKLLTLPNELEIYPGHQAGSACGAGLSGKPSSTIGFEKRFNPALGMDKAAFVREVTANIPPRPADMDRIVAANIAA